MIGDALTTRLELTLDLRLEFLSAHLDGVHASTAQGSHGSGSGRRGGTAVRYWIPPDRSRVPGGSTRQRRQDRSIRGRESFS